MAKEKEKEKEKKETLTERDDAGRKSPEDGGISSDRDDSDRRERRRRKKSLRKHGHGRRRSPSESSDGSESESDYSSSAESSVSGSAEEDDENGADEVRRRRKRRRKEREHEKERERRRKEKEREKKRRRKKEREEKEKKKKKKKEEKKKMVAVTNSWGKYGIIRETDMWNKRPEFTAWLAEIKQVNMESLSNREEKQMFKEFMEDHNTATFPSKKYYNLDAYHRRMILKEAKKGSRKTSRLERTVFNDEEQRRQELLMERERQKEEQVKALKYSMESGMAQAMKEQAQLREEMNYQYRLGNFEAAAAIQRRLDPDLPM